MSEAATWTWNLAPQTRFMAAIFPRFPAVQQL